jgi:ABC-type multidrug transport system fused ATPase/permease subunit
MYAFKLFYKYIHNFKLNFFFLVLSSFLSSVFNALSIVSLVPIVSLILDSKIDPKIINILNQFLDFDFSQLTKNDFVLLFILLFVISGFFKIFNDYFIVKIKVNFLSLYLEDTLDLFFKTDWHFFYMNDIGKITNSIYKELDKVGSSLMSVLQLISNFFLISVIVWIPFLVSSLVTFYSLMAIIFLLVPIQIINIFFYKIGKKITLESSFFSRVFFYSIAMYKNITANAGNSSTINVINQSYKRINIFEIIKKILNSSISEFLKVFAILFIFIIFGISVKFNLGFAESAAILYSFIRIFPHFNNSVAQINSIKDNKYGFELIENLKLKSKNLTSSWGTEKFDNVKNDIKFENVLFNYPNGKNALKNINLTIKKGEMVALFGKSGSGKSTILDLLAGLNKCTAGKILIDDQNLNNFDRISFSRNIGYVDANINLFPYSIKENIRIFFPNASDKEFLYAYRFVNLEDEFKILKDNIEVFSNSDGSLISSGQKQRICIARAIIKKPKIIILDEATNYLDDKNEDLILRNLEKIKKQNIILFATHKKSILKYFDKIIFIKDGEIEKIN